MFCTENKQTRGGSPTPRSSMMELFVTIEVISYWQSSPTLMMEESQSCLCMLISSVSVMKLESWMKTKTKRTQAFHVLVSSFFSRCEENNFLLPLLRNSCSLIDPFVFWRFYKALFESIPLFWKYSNNL